MKCPYCSSNEINTIDTRDSDGGETTKRKKQCASCGAKFTTIEKALKKDILVLKKNSETELFDIDKLFTAIMVSAGKRLKDEQITEIVENISNKIENSGVFQIETSKIAEMVLDSLERIDKIVYIRFASVYLDLETTDDIKILVEKMSKWW